MIVGNLKYLGLLILINLLGSIYCQENNEEDIPENRSSHMLVLSTSHTHVRKAIAGGEPSWTLIPSLGLDYNYVITENFQIGLHNDIILQDFEVELHADNTLIVERNYPVSTVLMFGYFPIYNFGMLIGAGAEWEKDKSFALIRFAIKAPIYIRKGWKMYFSTFYDYKVNGYDNLVVGIGVGYLFPKRKNKKE